MDTWITTLLTTNWLSIKLYYMSPRPMDLVSSSVEFVIDLEFNEESLK